MRQLTKVGGLPVLIQADFVVFEPLSISLFIYFFYFYNLMASKVTHANKKNINSHMDKP